MPPLKDAVRGILSQIPGSTVISNERGCAPPPDSSPDWPPGRKTMNRAMIDETIPPPTLSADLTHRSSGGLGCVN